MNVDKAVSILDEYYPNWRSYGGNRVVKWGEIYSPETILLLEIIRRAVLDEQNGKEDMSGYVSKRTLATDNLLPDYSVEHILNTGGERIRSKTTKGGMVLYNKADFKAYLKERRKYICQLSTL